MVKIQITPSFALASMAASSAATLATCTWGGGGVGMPSESRVDGRPPSSFPPSLGEPSSASGTYCMEGKIKVDSDT